MYMIKQTHWFGETEQRFENMAFADPDGGDLPLPHVAEDDIALFERITFSADEDLSYKDISSSESNLQGILEEFLPQGKQSSDLPTMTNADKPNQSIEKSGVQCQTVKTTAQDSGPEQYKCEVCHIPFRSKTKLATHKRKHTEDNPYLCVYCGDTFKYHNELSEHRRSKHLSNKSFKCDHCPMSFETRRQLDAHMWRHTGERKFKCNICDKTYPSKASLDKHLDRHKKSKGIKGLKLYKCTLCPKEYYERSSVEYHVRAEHTGERPYKCRQCDASFTTFGTLTVHQLVHTEEKPFLCDVCGKSWKSIGRLKIHKRVHSDLRPYKCHLCTKTFKIKRSLRLHIDQHGKWTDRLIKCPFCSGYVSSGKQIYAHLKTKHQLKGEITEEERFNLAKTLKPNLSQEEKDILQRKKEELKKKRAEQSKRKRCSRLCPLCPKVSQMESSYKAHIARAHKLEDVDEETKKKHPELLEILAKPDPCKFCDKEFNTHYDLKYHIVFTHPDEAKEMGLSCDEFRCKAGTRKKLKYECERCNEKFAYKPVLLKHIKQVHIVKKLKKEKTKKRKTTGNENENKTPKIEDQKFSCSQCDMTFPWPKLLLLHLVHFHGEDQNKVKRKLSEKDYEVCIDTDKKTLDEISGYSCTECKETFLVKKLCDLHLQHFHGQRRNCNIENEAEGKLIHSQNSIFPQSVDYPYRCNECGQYFAFSNLLAVHLRHFHNKIVLARGDKSADPNYLCKECGEHFSFSNLLKVHLTHFHNYEYVTKQDLYDMEFKGSSLPVITGLSEHNEATHPNQTNASGKMQNRWVLREPRTPLQAPTFAGSEGNTAAISIVSQPKQNVLQSSINTLTATDGNTAVTSEVIGTKSTFPETKEMPYILPNSADLDIDENQVRKNRFKCWFCAVNFSLSENLVDHMQRVHASVPDAASMLNVITGLTQLSNNQVESKTDTSKAVQKVRIDNMTLDSSDDSLPSFVSRSQFIASICSTDTNTFHKPSSSLTGAAQSTVHLAKVPLSLAGMANIVQNIPNEVSRNLHQHDLANQSRPFLSTNVEHNTSSTKSVSVIPQSQTCLLPFASDKATSAFWVTENEIIDKQLGKPPNGYAYIFFPLAVPIAEANRIAGGRAGLNGLSDGLLSEESSGRKGTRSRKPYGEKENPSWRDDASVPEIGEDFDGSLSSNSLESRKRVLLESSTQTNVQQVEKRILAADNVSLTNDMHYSSILSNRTQESTQKQLGRPQEDDGAQKHNTRIDSSDLSGSEIRANTRSRMRKGNPHKRSHAATTVETYKRKKRTHFKIKIEAADDSE